MRKGFARFSTDGHQTRFISFAGHANYAFFKIKILQSRVCQLGNSEPAA